MVEHLISIWPCICHYLMTSDEDFHIWAKDSAEGRQSDRLKFEMWVLVLIDLSHGSSFITIAIDLFYYLVDYVAINHISI